MQGNGNEAGACEANRDLTGVHKACHPSEQLLPQKGQRLKGGQDLVRILKEDGYPLPLC